MLTGRIAGLVLCGTIVCAAWLWGRADGKRGAAELPKPPAPRRIAVINLASIIQQCSRYRSLRSLDVVRNKDEEQIAALFRDVQAAARRPVARASVQECSMQASSLTSGEGAPKEAERQQREW